MTRMPAAIGRLLHAVPLWGAPRTHGGLQKLGFEVAQSSVAKYMVKRCGLPSPAPGLRVWANKGAHGRLSVRRTNHSGCLALQTIMVCGLETRSDD